jgi:hypothetical protein
MATALSHSYLDKLHEVGKSLPFLLQNNEWQGLFIDYHPPVVERLWLQHGAMRVCLHRIHTCRSDEALFHPHPWPSAVLLVSGRYEQCVGYGDPSGPAPPKIGPQILVAGSAYEMSDPNEWHYVRPIDRPSLSLMVMGPPFGGVRPAKQQELRPLTSEEKAALLADFRELYPG